MKTRHTAPELVRSLSRHGLTFRSFSVQSQGVWTTEDADWNYKDVPHLNVVHTLASAVPAAIGDEIVASVNMQKAAGVTMPIALANYVASDGSQVYYTTMLCYVLVVETRIREIADSQPVGNANVETTYHVGGPKVAMWAFPLLRRILRSNYEVLMSEDIPMRERRGRLRKAGYGFASDGRPRTFAETVDLTVCNVVAPRPDLESVQTIDLSQLREGSSTVAGSGPGGLRIVRRSNEEIAIYNRVCDHEGASLDAATVSGDCLVCPWHAKRVKPLAVAQLNASGSQKFEVGPGYEVILEAGSMTIRGVA